MIPVTRPTLIIDRQRCQSNIQKMALKSGQANVVFRPHFKTHQSPLIAEWFRPFGVEKICVSSVEMAGLFSDHGWSDITIAFPVNYLQMKEINDLNSKIRLNLLVESMDSLSFLAENLQSAAGIFIEIDTGYHRSGISYLAQESIDAMIHFLASEKILDFQGFIIHSGNTYQADNLVLIRSTFEHDLAQLSELKKRYQGIFPHAIISMGDTPSCTVIDDFSGVDEIRPGNFVFYDIMQFQLGVCRADEIAVAVACPVVAKNPSRNEIVIYGGAVHLSKESLADPEASVHYGLIVQFNDDGWGKPLEGTRLVSLSQEHGIIRTTEEVFDQIHRGDIIGVLPVHSCLTNDLLLDHTRVINERY